MSSQFLSQEGSQVQATARKAALANSVLHLFKYGFNPSPSTTLTQLLAQECDFDSYAPATIATWDGPVLAPGSGWMIFSPQQVFIWAHVTDDVTNVVGGWFLVDAGGALADVQIFDAPGQPMQGPGQSVIQVCVEVFPTTPS